MSASTHLLSPGKTSRPRRVGAHSRSASVILHFSITSPWPFVLPLSFKVTLREPRRCLFVCPDCRRAPAVTLLHSAGRKRALCAANLPPVHPSSSERWERCSSSAWPKSETDGVRWWLWCWWWGGSVIMTSEHA